MTIAAIVLAITCGGGSRETGGTPSKDNGTLKKWLDRLAEALKKLVGKAAEALPPIVGSIVGAILSFFWEGYWIYGRTYLAPIVFVA